MECTGVWSGNQRVLDITLVAFVEVDIVIVVIGQRRGDVGCATEPLDTVIWLREPEHSRSGYRDLHPAG